MKFSAVMPSFRNSRWLKLCLASVAGQQGVELEHIVQDSCSDDGTQDWLPQDRRVRAFIEKDSGMYDAINRGYRRAQGDILVCLNCDEQYLPGALKTVRDFFDAHPEVEVALAGTIVVDGRGNYMCHRHALVPHPQHMWFRFSALTSSVFLRRHVISKRGIFFDTRRHDLGGFYWVLALMQNQVPLAVCNEFTSIFTDTGENMGLKPNAIREKNERAASIPHWVRVLKPVWIAHHRLRRLAAGHFSLSRRVIPFTRSTARRSVCGLTCPSPRPSGGTGWVWWNRLPRIELSSMPRWHRLTVLCKIEY
jgi:glycosyltransferase involved in cell wall biosynthesis